MINSKSTYPEISKEASEAIERLREHIGSLPEERRHKVCISSIAYNQEAFIAQTLEGFVMQQTDFPFVAVVHDDASTDGTANIIREYADKYPDIIFPIFERENQYRKPGGPLTLIMHLAQEATRAPYIAKCEGDDYWTSPQKLQMQVDFLDKNPEYVMCSHGCTYHDISDDSYSHPMEPIEREYDWSWIFESGRPWPMQTLTVLYRSKAMVLDEFLKYKVRYDMILFWYLLHKGKGYKFKEEMAMYTVHNGGIWSSLSRVKKWDFCHRMAKALFEADPSPITLDFFFSSLHNAGLGRIFVLTKRFSKFYSLCCLCARNVGWFKTSKRLLSYLIKG